MVTLPSQSEHSSGKQDSLANTKYPIKIESLLLMEIGFDFFIMKSGNFVNCKSLTKRKMLHVV